MSPRRTLLSLVSLLLLPAGPVVGATTTFSDETFSDAEWTSVTSLGFLNGQTASQAADGGSTGGSPDPFWSVTTVTAAATTTFHSRAAFVIDPSVTPIVSIDFAINYKNIFSYGQGMAIRFAVEQGGTYYVLSGAITGAATDGPWTPLSENSITASDFSAGGPDFSASGAPVTFGFETGNSGGSTINVGYDDYSAVITVVPEPSSALLALAGFGLLGVRRRHS